MATLVRTKLVITTYSHIVTNIYYFLSSLLNCVSYVLTCQRALRAYMLNCQRALRAYVLTCLECLRVHVPCMLCVPTYSRDITKTSFQ